jgi:AcrR family transcriptional regulator
MSEAPTLRAPARGGSLSRRERKKKRTRRDIYDAAMGLFARRGFDGVTIAEICEAADVGHGTFFLHFPTKAALLHELNTRVAEAFRAERAEGTAPQRSARDELTALVERMSVQLQSQAEIVRAMLAEFFSSPESLAPAAMQGDALPELVAEIIEAGQARGEFSRRVDARLGAAAFLATAGAILSGRVFREGELSAADINRQFLQITFSGLASGEEPTD